MEKEGTQEGGVKITKLWRREQKKKKLRRENNKTVEEKKNKNEKGEG